jgi:hypothetical protein
MYHVFVKCDQIFLRQVKDSATALFQKRGLCGLVCRSRTSERGGEGDCVKEGGGR